MSVLFSLFREGWSDSSQCHPSRRATDEEREEVKEDHGRQEGERISGEPEVRHFFARTPFAGPLAIDHDFIVRQEPGTR